MNIISYPPCKKWIWPGIVFIYFVYIKQLGWG